MGTTVTAVRARATAAPAGTAGAPGAAMAHPAPVTLGPDNGTVVAVTKGLDQGQVVVTDGADRLKDGAKVEIVPPASPADGQDGQAPGQPRTRGQGQGHGQHQQQGSGQPPAPTQQPTPQQGNGG